MAVAIGLGTGIIVVTIGVTIARYRDLPKTIPIHFGFDGKPNGYGPRGAIWIAPAVQLLLAASTLSAGSQTPHISPIFWLAILVLCLAVQLLIIGAATNGTQRLDMRVFWGAFVGTIGVAVAAAFRWIG
jgi:uncharacterized membrane protein